jgi:hypothetical protein
MQASLPLTAVAIPLLALGCNRTPLEGRRPEAAAQPAPDATTTVVPAGPVIIASGQASPTTLALHDGHLYWLNLGVYHENSDSRIWWWNQAQVMKCPKSGCPNSPTALVSGRMHAMNQPSFNFATDGEYVYWSDDGPDVPWDGGATNGGVFRCSVVGCNDTPVRLSDKPAYSLAVTDGSLYAFRSYSPQLETCLTSGCASPPNLLWRDDAGTNLASGVAIAADARDVYCTTRSSLMRCGRGGCNNAPTILATSGNVIWDFGPIALDTSNVYFGHGPLWLDGQQRSGEILACAKAGCAGSPSLVGTSPTGPASLATDGIDVYWTERDASGPYYTALLRKCPVAGCGDGPITVASGFGGPSTVAVDDDCVYWTDAGDSNQGGYGRIWRAPK